jgi:radical SAM protein with 4Fe4S-binding SPASM domain
MCHVAFLNEKPEFLDLDRITDFSFLKDKTVILGAVFEPFIHPEINKLIDILNRQSCRLVIITNAKNLHKNSLVAIYEADLDSVTFSFDGITQASYEAIRKGGNYHQTLKNIDRFRIAFSKQNTFFAVNYTVMSSNLNEVAKAPAFWEEYDIDLIRFISMVVRNESKFLEQNSLWDKRASFFQALDLAAESVEKSDYRISISSPYFQSLQAREKWPGRLKEGVFKSKKACRFQRLYHREFEYGAMSGMEFPCRSPFVAARITWDGTVNLCHNVAIGNLYHKTFTQIWNGQRAETYRNQVFTNKNICMNCDYFRYCINSHYIDLNNRENYYDKNMREKKV